MSFDDQCDQQDVEREKREETGKLLSRMQQVVDREQVLYQCKATMHPLSQVGVGVYLRTVSIARTLFFVNFIIYIY
jgi:hypothetical protein